MGWAESGGHLINQYLYYLISSQIVSAFLLWKQYKEKKKKTFSSFEKNCERSFNSSKDFFFFAFAHTIYFPIWNNSYRVNSINVKTVSNTVSYCTVDRRGVFFAVI